MAIVRVNFAGGNVPVVVGATPASIGMPIANPAEVGTTNMPFLMLAGTHCFGIVIPGIAVPLWQIGEAIDGQELVLEFGTV